AENFRKLLLPMVDDIRVILVKLADRLHNMRTLQHLPEERRLKIAKETLDIYAPLANRLGIQWMKIELEGLAFKFLKPEAYHEIEEKMALGKAKVEVYIDRVSSVLSPKLTEYKVHHEIYGRLKHHFSIFRKMQDQNISFEQIHDLIALRLIVDDIRECYTVLGVIHELWTPVPGRVTDYI